jgi:hypothetical protein
MRDTLAEWLDSVQLGAPDYEAEGTGTEYLTITPQCSLTEEIDVAGTGLRCKDEARKWALAETKDWLEARSLTAAILVGGAWLTWLTVVVRYRRQTGLLWSLRAGLQRRFAGGRGATYAENSR